MVSKALVLYILLLMMILLIPGCIMTYGDQNLSSFTPTTDQEFQNESGSIDLFFKGFELKREYKEIGFVEAVGKDYATNELMLDHLKYQAYMNGADAVIHVRKEFISRESGILFDEDVKYYEAPVFTGVAVKYIDTLKVDHHIPVMAVSDNPPAFVHTVERDYNEASQETEKQIMGSILIAIISLVAGLWAASREEM